MSNDTNTAGGHSAAWDRAMKAVGDKDTEALRTLVAARPDLAQKHDAKKFTLLNLAAWANAAQCAEVLLAAGAAIDAVDFDSNMPHHYAAENVCLEMLGLLLVAGAPVDAPGFNRTALFARMDDDAGQHGDYAYGNVLGLLLDFGADPNLDPETLSLAIYHDSWEYIALLLIYGGMPHTSGPRETHRLEELLLHAAGDYVKTEVMLYLIGQGANIKTCDALGRTPLHLVAGSTTANDTPEYHAEVITDLVRLGADASVKDSEGKTALNLSRAHDELPEVEAALVAAMQEAEMPWRCAWSSLLSGDLDALGRVLDARPEIVGSANMDGDTLLHLAPHDGGAAIRLLVELDADIEARNATGEMPLFNAVRRDRTDATLGAHKSATESSTDVLTVMGASLHARSKGGVTPLHVAAKFSRTQCLSERINDKAHLQDQAAAWQERRNTSAAKIDWRFTTNDARVKLKKLYPTILSG